MSIQSSEKILWVDVICLSSLFYIFKKRDLYDRVLYISLYKPAKPFLLIFKFFFNLPLSRIRDTVESELKFGNISLYESIQNLISQTLDESFTEDFVQRGLPVNSKISKNFSFNFTEYLKESAYYLILHPLEIFQMSKCVNASGKNAYLLKNSHIDEIIRKVYSGEELKFYNFSLHIPQAISGRERYFNDRYLYHYLSFSRNILILFSKWLQALLTKIIFFPWVKKYTPNQKYNIVAELSQNTYKKNSLDDLFWLNASNIKPESVYAISYKKLDTKSENYFLEKGVNLCAPVSSFLREPIKTIKCFRSILFLSANFTYFAKSFFILIRLIRLLFMNNNKKWFYFLYLQFLVRVRYWESIYKSIDLAIFWTMLDIDSEKLIKIQAVKNIGGVSISSHWSLYPLRTAINKKFTDLILTWGDFFSKSHFNGLENSTCKNIGYISDYIFKETSKEKLVKPSKIFQITYFDNIVGNDIGYSENMQFEIFNMFSRLIDSYPNIVIQVKPKRGFDYSEDFKSQISYKHLQNKKIKFIIEPDSHRAMPHIVASKSNLTLGMGISTAAAECNFSGIISLHADLTGFLNNNFANPAIDKIVFRDIQSLENAIRKQINGKGITLKSAQNYYKLLDSFNDGKAHIRAGEIISNIQSNFTKQVSKYLILEKFKK